MFIPGFSKPISKSRSLQRRKGGGGTPPSTGGGGSRGSTGNQGSTGNNSSGRTGNTGSNTGSNSRGSSVSNTNGKYANSRTQGSTRVNTIPPDLPFAGRKQGGGTRAHIYGTPIYGSGYIHPIHNRTQHGTRGLDLPFYFWPLAWGGVASYAEASYMYDTEEYGRFDNTSRPGGVMQIATYSSKSTNATFRIIADEMTVSSLIESISRNCSTIIASNSSTSPTPYDPNSPSPKPEQVIQYYRASTLALSMDGYNNTGASSELAESNESPSPLPPYVDRPLLACLNETIGQSAPLIDDSESGTTITTGSPSTATNWSGPGNAGNKTSPGFQLIAVIWLLWLIRAF